MRKHSARKWLHAILDLLPVVLIPVFMIYSHRHQIDSYEVQYQENKVVDFNQLNNFNNIELYQDFNIEVVNNTYNITYDISGITNENVYLFIDTFNIYNNHKYYLKTSYYTNVSNAYFYLTNVYESGDYLVGDSDTIAYIRFAYLSPYENIDISTPILLFDLTQMFGAGNEPTITQFDQWYSNDYYEYTLGHKELLKGYQTITYDDTDIGSQFFYCLYNSVDKYFNMGNVFNMTGVYDWFVLNIFGGNAPLSIYIVWNIVLYEFIMDLLFLLYALFMFFIDTCTNLMDRFYGNLSGRR